MFSIRFRCHTSQALTWVLTVLFVASQVSCYCLEGLERSQSMWSKKPSIFKKRINVGLRRVLQRRFHFASFFEDCQIGENVWTGKSCRAAFSLSLAMLYPIIFTGFTIGTVRGLAVSFRPSHISAELLKVLYKTRRISSIISHYCAVFASCFIY